MIDGLLVKVLIITNFKIKYFNAYILENLVRLGNELDGPHGR